MRVMAGAVLFLAIAAPAASAASVTDGKARFELITPSLIRLQYAADGNFETGRTQTTEGRLRSSGSFRTSEKNGRRIIRTSRLTLRWRRGSGPFSASNLTVVVGRRALHPAPGPNPSPLGGWRRSLDLVDGPRPLHEGVLSREGWYLLDDSKTPIVSGDSLTPRAVNRDDYQDLYLFAYGTDYARALRDLRVLTGAAPLLPRKAFGVWFSRYWPYSADDWKPLLERFRSEKVPLDTISLDTDYKAVHDPAGAAIASQIAGAPGGNYSWNGWDWNRRLYPDPVGFFAWARSMGLNTALNIHPSIDSTDPQFGATQQRAGGGLKPDDGCRVTQADPNGQCMVFDWTDPKQRDAYFALHDHFEKDGASFWWLDWCCDGTKADAPGLTPDTWINKLYFERQRARGSRWPAFQRIGGSFQLGFEGATGNGAFAEHRYTLQFTGDTCGTWPLLKFASEFTAAEASIGLPYVSHDIGTFHAVSPSGVCDKTISPILTPRENSLPGDMYARWVQLGTFQPLLRLHSHHGKRLPWEYPGKAGEVAANFLRLREALVPYLYTLAASARATGVPIVRPLYLQWPRQSAAYDHPSEYMLGRDVLVAPVTEPGDPAEAEVWFPPGTWVDWFTGERHRGGRTETLSVPLERMPLFVRAGAIVPTQPEVPTTPVASPSKVILTVFPGRGRATLYDDAGDGLDRRHATTSIRQRRGKLVIGPMKGSYAGRPARRSWEIRVIRAGETRTIRSGARSVRKAFTIPLR
jgi:alpha-glucosidase (family GH31 glycosyl hydrolase)